MSGEYELSLIRRMDAAYAACQRTGNPVICKWYRDLRARVDARMPERNVVPFRRREEAAS